MKAAIITIGDEILIGQIVDTNSSFIAKSLDKIGIQTVEIHSISDNKQPILETFSQLQNKVALVIITGGLGPTKDDITKHTLCDYFQDTLIQNTAVEKHVIDLIKKTLGKTASQINKDQALVPSKCEVLHNQVGTAPGLWIKKENTLFISLPGVPYEMKYLIENQVIPKLVQEYQRPHIIHKTILTYGQAESDIAERLEDWENQLPEYIKLAYLPSPGQVRLRLTARGTDKKQLEKIMAENIKSLDAIIHDTIVGFEEEATLEVVIGKNLKEKNKTIATAESCTGGKIAHLLTSVSGASEYFKGSIVCYSTASKIDVLKIPETLIHDHSVVSSEVALAMATSVKKIMCADYAIATTGNAGPTKGDSQAKIGIVFIALATPNNVIVQEFNFGQPREKVIEKTALKGLEMLRKEISKKGF